MQFPRLLAKSLSQFISRRQLLPLSAIFLFTAGLALAQPSARVRVIHASPDAPAVDIYVDGAIALDNLAYQDATDYVNVPSGQRVLQVFVAGTNTRVAEVTASLSTGLSYSVVAAGFAGAGKTPGFRLLLLQDSLPLDTNWSYVRVVHGAPSAPAVDVYAGAPFAALRSASPALTGVPFAAASGYLPLRPGSLMARVTPAGTKTIAIQSPTLRLVSGGVYTVIAVDKPTGGAPFSFLVLQDR